jgi:hypothetical protein
MNHKGFLTDVIITELCKIVHAKASEDKEHYDSVWYEYSQVIAKKFAKIAQEAVDNEIVRQDLRSTPTHREVSIFGMDGG